MKRSIPKPKKVQESKNHSRFPLSLSHTHSLSLFITFSHSLTHSFLVDFTNENTRVMFTTMRIIKLNIFGSCPVTSSDKIGALRNPGKRNSSSSPSSPEFVNCSPWRRKKEKMRKFIFEVIWFRSQKWLVSQRKFLCCGRRLKAKISKYFILVVHEIWIGTSIPTTCSSVSIASRLHT